MSSLHTKYSEWRTLNNQIKDLETKLKLLKSTQKKKMEELYTIMSQNEIEEYFELKKEQVKPKERKKPLTAKKKKEALIQYFAKLGINEPEKFIQDIKNIEKNAKKD